MHIVNIPRYYLASQQSIHPESIIISINSIEGNKSDLLDLRRFRVPILALEFNDITTDMYEDSEEDFSKHLFNVSHANRIIQFIMSNIVKEYCVVHCDAGVSRSGAVALALHMIFDHIELPHHFWSRSHPNPFILATMLASYGGSINLVNCSDKTYDELFKQIFV